MDINNWITFVPAHGAAEKAEEIESVAKQRLSKDLQSRLRNNIDPGIDLKSARRAQSIRVQASGGRLVIDEDDQAKLFSGGEPEKGSDSEPLAPNLEDLFKPGSGVPESVTQPDGSSKLVFRSILADDLFGQQIKNERTSMVEKTITDVLRTNTVDAIEDAMQEVDRLYPELKGK
jgi:hypothetical protein